MTRNGEATMLERIRSSWRGSAAVLVSAAALAASGPPAHAGVTIALEPATQVVATGAEFDLYVTVTGGGSAFNAFDAVVGYSPAALTLVELSPISLQEGPLMTGACSSRFHRFRRGVDRDTVTDVLLCNGVSVSGPGTIYRLRYQASTTPQTTSVSLLPGVAFYDAGLAVTPVTTANATVVIGTPVDVEAPLPRTSALRLVVRPNPSRSVTGLRVEVGASGIQELVVCDVTGRVVRRLESGWFVAGARSCDWDGRDDSGARVAPGIYYASLRAPTGLVRSPIVRME